MPSLKLPIHEICALNESGKVAFNKERLVTLQEALRHKWLIIPSTQVQAESPLRIPFLF